MPFIKTTRNSLFEVLLLTVMNLMNSATDSEVLSWSGNNSRVLEKTICCNSCKILSPRNSSRVPGVELRSRS